MDNLVPSTSTWGTSDLLATGTEYYPSTSQAQLVNNIGFLQYIPKTIFSGILGDNLTYYTYIPKGTYTAFFGFTAVVPGTSIINGTTLFTSPAGNATGTYSDFAVAADGFGTLTLSGVGVSECTWTVSLRREGR